MRHCNRGGTWGSVDKGAAPEMEELGKDERVMPEALVPPVLKARPVVVMKIKTQQLKVPQGEE